MTRPKTEKGRQGEQTLHPQPPVPWDDMARLTERVERLERKVDSPVGELAEIIARSLYQNEVPARH